MIRFFTLVFCICLQLRLHAQADTTYIETQYAGPCYNNDGVLDSPEWVYTVKKFKPRASVELSIKKITVGNRQITVNGYFKGNVGGDTKLIQLNNSFAVKLVLARVTENGVNKYLYKLLVMKHDMQTNCWRSLAPFNFNEVYSSKVSFSGYSMGYQERADFFRVDEGWMTIDG